MTSSPSQLVSKHREILCSSVRVRTEETVQSSSRSDAPHMQDWSKCWGHLHIKDRSGTLKIKNSSKNGDCNTPSVSFIPPHIYDTWHRDKRESIKCMGKSTCKIYSPKPCFLELKEILVHGVKDSSHTLLSLCR